MRQRMLGCLFVRLAESNLSLTGWWPDFGISRARMHERESCGFEFQDAVDPAIQSHPLILSQ